ncbi:glycosyltransferase family 2 protein [Bacillus sp. AK128]
MNNKNPLVSIIVPIYKVEKYIHRCLESITSQSYYNLEIILVNDGSPDDCGIIADRYAEVDRRIRVIHKENGGLSDARNYGVKEATGEYIVFIDSDDWIKHNMIEELVKNALNLNADVVQSAFYYAYEDKFLFDNRYYDRDAAPQIIDKEQLMKQLIKNEKVKNFAWGKIYKTNLIKDIPFKKGVLFEDVFWAHQVLHRVKVFVLLNQPLCYYFQRDNSIVSTYTIKNLDFIKGLLERHKFINKYYGNLSSESLVSILKASLIHYRLLLINKGKDPKKFYRKKLQMYIKQNRNEYYKVFKKHPELVFQLFLFNLTPYLYLLYLIIKKVIRILNLKKDASGLEEITL